MKNIVIFFLLMAGILTASPYDAAIAQTKSPFAKTLKTLYAALEAGKKKRNVGDAFKHIVSDNWKVDMVITFNLRSLKN